MKKRILSLILALSMVLSVFPLGAFAEGSTQDLVMQNGYPVGSIGDGWWYRNDTLYLNDGEYDFRYTNPKTKTGRPTKQAVLCAIVIFFGVEMTGGTFNKTVANNGGTIKNGTFEGTVENYFGGTISNGIFNGTVTNRSTIENGTFEGTVENYYEGKISDGTFEGEVKNKGTISDGTFQSTSNVINEKEITGGKFEGTVMNNTGRTISGGTFRGKVDNSGNITGGIFAAGLSKNDGSVTGGVFNGKTGLTDALQVTVTNGSVSQVNDEGPLNADGTPGTTWDLYAYAGTTVTITASTEIFSLNGQPIGADDHVNGNKNTVKFTMPDKDVVLNGAITSTDLVMEKGWPKASNEGKISCSGTGWSYDKNTKTLTLTSGTYDFSSTHPQNPSAGTRPAPAVQCAIYIQPSAEITDGTFSTTVNNYTGGTISGGTFAAGLSDNYGTVTGGVFNGNTALTDARHVTVTDGSLLKVNGVDPRNADGTTGTAWDLYSYAGTTMTITANTEIFSLNGQPINESSYGSDKTIVTFTMPDKDVVLNGAITCTDLVMEKGWPKASNEGKISCSGTGWEYIKKSSGSTNTGTLYLMSGSEPFDFNFADPATKITRTDAAVKCAIESYGTISGGIFDGTVTNNAGGEISDGTFKGDVENSGYIEKGTFNGEVTNNTSGTIFGGTFRGQVDNNGKITGGIFAAGLSTTPGTVTGGIFNGNTGLTGAHQVTVTNGSVSTVNDEGPRNADGTWDLYSYKDTTMTIIASTEIFSLNGKSIGDGNCNSSYGVDKKTVTFTMPNANVVLNGAITSTDLVMENGWPKDSDGGKNPCKGDGWEYIKNDPTNGDMLLLTGSSQTGGLFDFSTIGDGAAVECNVFVGKPTAITGTGPHREWHVQELGREQRHYRKRHVPRQSQEQRHHREGHL